MAYELRRQYLDLSVSLQTGIGIDSQLITAKGTGFTNLPSDLSTSSYIPLVIADDNAGKSEVVWATSHSATSPTLGIVRGREGTNPQQFDAGAIVRCSPTVRDVIAPYANRAALPSDPHNGMRALLLDTGTVVEKTSTGWNDSATLKDDPKRKHRWSQAGASTAAGSGQTISGLTGGQTNTTGNLATVTAGQALLNEPGDWFLQLAMFAANANNRNQGLGFIWPSGAFPGSSTRYDYRAFFGGSGIAGNGLVLLEWEGYVSADAATKPITLEAFSTVALTGCQYDFYAEYKGR